MIDWLPYRLLSPAPDHYREVEDSCRIHRISREVEDENNEADPDTIITTRGYLIWPIV